MTAHGEDLHDQVQNTDLVRQIMTDYSQADLSEAELSMLDFAVRLTLAPAGMTESDIKDLRSRGFDEEAILEIAHITAYFNYMNRIVSALGVDPEPEWNG